MPRPSRRLLVVAVLVLLAITGGWWWRRGTDQAPPTALVTRGQLARSIETTGVVQPAKPVTARTSVSGAVSLVAVRPGDHVLAGDIVAVLDPAPFSRALAAARRAADAAALDATARAAQATPVDDTFGPAIAARLQVSDARAAVAAATADLQATDILAPVAGTVLDVGVVPGGPYQTGMPAATISADDRLQVSADLDQVDVPNVAVGTAVDLVLDAFPATAATGRVTAIAPTGRAAGGGTVFTVTIAPIDLGGAAVRPGMTATVTIPTQLSPAVILVPAGAVATVGRRTFVQRVRAGRTERIEVRLGGRGNGVVAIAAGAIQPGDRVVVVG